MQHCQTPNSCLLRVAIQIPGKMVKLELLQESGGFIRCLLL